METPSLVAMLPERHRLQKDEVTQSVGGRQWKAMEGAGQLTKKLRLCLYTYVITEVVKVNVMDRIS